MDNEHTMEEIQELLSELPYDLIDNAYDQLKELKTNYEDYLKRKANNV